MNQITKKYSFVLVAVFLSTHALKASEEVFITPYTYTHAPQSTNPAQRFSSYPYIAGDTFRVIGDFIVDETKIPFKPSAVKNGDIIFLNTDLAWYFFAELHPRIQSKYILVTHNSDLPVPGKFEAYLQDEKLVAWFGQNTNIIHPKVHPIPIGIANNYWRHGNTKVLDLLLPQASSIKKDKLLYLNIGVGNNMAARAPVYQLFSQQPFCYKASNLPWHEYLIEMGKSKFVLSPHGNGLDCHRTWETLLMGSIPIVTPSTLDKLYENLPVLIIEDWNQITEQFLLQKYEEIRSKTYHLEKLYAQYWFDQIKNMQINIRKQSYENKY